MSFSRLLNYKGRPYNHKFLGFRALNPQDVDSYIASAAVVPIDLRSREEFEEAHLPGSVHLPVERWDAFQPEPGKEYLFYCRNGRLSEDAYFAIKEKFPNASLCVLRFGFQAWRVETANEDIRKMMDARERKAVVLMTPPANPKKLWGKFTELNGFYMPIQIMTIADTLDRNGIETHIFDASAFKLSHDDLLGFLKKVRPAVVGITTYTATAYDVWYTSKVIKEFDPGIKVIAGGIHCSIFPEKSMDECPHLDAVCFGEGEATMLEFCKHVMENRGDDCSQIQGLCIRENGKVRKLHEREQIPESRLAEFLNPAYHLVPMEFYIPPAANYYNLPTYSTFVSRGCPFKCNFCNAGDVFGALGRYRPVAHVINELRYLQKHYNMKGMYFMDGTFATNQQWVHRFCDAVIEQGMKLEWFTWTRTDLVTQELAHKMKKSGCWKVGVGVESGNQQSLDLLRKGLRLEQVKRGIRYFQNAGIQVNCSFMLGIPGETQSHVENTLRFAKDLKTESAIFFLPVPMPGGELYDLARKYGGLRETGLEDWSDYSTFNFKNPIYINPLIGKEKMIEYYDTSFSRFFLDPAVIWRNLRTVRNIRDIVRLASGFKSIIYFFNPKLLAKSLTQRFIAYQGADKIVNANLQLPDFPNDNSHPRPTSHSLN